MSEQFWTLLTAAVGGGFFVEVFKLAFGEGRSWLARRNSDAETIVTNLEPMLKASDELVGKLTSLGRSDFLVLRRSPSKDLSDDEYVLVAFLFIQFWARLELFRIDFYDNKLGDSDTGRRLSKFYDCLESRDVRIVDRIYQRALGEAAAQVDGSPSFLDFARLYKGDADFRRWTEPLVGFLGRMDEPKSRQRMLRYTIILHVMIDSLDPKHKITRDRPSISHKLSKDSLRELEYRWLGKYLKFVPTKAYAKYLGPPDGRP